MRLVGPIVERLRARSVARKRRALHRAQAEMKLRESRDGSIWRTGKGGAHHDR